MDQLVYAQKNYLRSNREHIFTKLPNSFIRNPVLSVRVKIGYAYLRTYAGKGEKAWPSHARIARELSISNNTVKVLLQDLEEAGLLEKTVKAFGKNNRYQLKILKAETEYVELQNWFIRTPKYSMNFKALYALLLSYQGDKEYAFPTYKEMRTDLAISSDQTIAKTLQTLTEKGLIEQVGAKAGLTNRYRVLDLQKYYLFSPEEV